MVGDFIFGPLRITKKKDVMKVVVNTTEGQLRDV